jgi:flagellar basal body P-ring formation protein FlgA
MMRLRLAIAVGLTAALLGPVTTWAETVTLKEEVYIKGPDVLLGEVAMIEGENPEALASLVVATAANPGGQRRVDAVLLLARLKTAGVDTDTIELKGARSVTARTLSLELTREAITEDLRRYIEANMPWSKEQATIDIPLPSQDLVVPDGEVTWDWRANPQYQWVGSTAFRGELRVDGAVKKTILCKASVEAFVSVLVAATDIPRGRMIRKSDVEARRYALSTIRYGALTNFDEAVGQLARSTIFPGTVLTNRSVMPRRLVKRYQTVMVETRAGNLLVRGRARAMEDGSAGDLIRLTNPESKAELFGLVREDGVVVVQ